MIIVYLAVLVFIVCVLYQIMKGIIAMFKKLFKKESKKEGIDFDKLNWNTFLKNEAKFRYQEHQVKRASWDDKITLGYILENVLDVDKKDISKMCVVLKDRSKEIKTSIIEETGAIWNYDLFSTIILQHEDGNWGFWQGQNTVLVIGYKPSHLVTAEEHDQSILCYDNSIIIFLRGLIGDGSTWYARASVMIPNFNHDDDDLKTQFSKNAPQVITFVLAFDAESPEEKQKKFEKVRLSLEEKVRESKELDEDESMLLQGITYDNSLGYDFGYGKYLFEHNRYTDALIPFLKVFEKLKMKYYDGDEQLKEMFFDTCYYIGYCFNELEKYDKAFFYLDIARISNKPTHKTEYINSLVNSGDVRALAYVDSEIDEIRAKKEKLDEEEVIYYRFLYRRLAYLYIEYKMFDEAKHLLEQMKNDEADRDFALGELEYLKNVMKEEK